MSWTLILDLRAWSLFTENAPTQIRQHLNSAAPEFPCLVSLQQPNETYSIINIGNVVFNNLTLNDMISDVLKTQNPESINQLGQKLTEEIRTYGI